MVNLRLGAAFMLFVLAAAGCSAHAGAKANDDSASARGSASVSGHSGSGSIRK